MDADKDPAKLTDIKELIGGPGGVPKMKTFSYRRPQELGRNRVFVPLVRSDIMIGAIQIIQKGGENQLHSHNALDGFWFVLKGSARFYGEGDAVLATLEAHEGIFIPRNFLYWFEAVGQEPLELLQVEAIDKTKKNEAYSPAPPKPGAADVYHPDGKLIARDLKIS